MATQAELYKHYVHAEDDSVRFEVMMEVWCDACVFFKSLLCKD